METLMQMFLDTIIIAFVASVAYFVIKKAVKDAIIETEKEKR